MLANGWSILEIDFCRIWWDIFLPLRLGMNSYLVHSLIQIIQITILFLNRLKNFFFKKRWMVQQFNHLCEGSLTTRGFKICIWMFEYFSQELGLYFCWLGLISDSWRDSLGCFTLEELYLWTGCIRTHLILFIAWIEQKGGKALAIIPF